MEEINEIIARSQTRAHQMMTTGSYSDDPHKLLHTRELVSPIPTITYMMNTSILSDGNRSLASDDITKDLSAVPDSGLFRPATGAKH